MQWGSKYRFQTTGFGLFAAGGLLVLLGSLMNAFFQYDEYLADVHFSKFFLGLALIIVGSGILVIGVAVMTIGSLRDS